MRITILGATGHIGSLVLTGALAAGHEVVILTRPTTPAVARVGVIAVAADLADPAAIRQAITGSGAVVAALGPRTNTLEDEIALEVGMRNLVSAMNAAGVARLIALSGAAVEVPGDAKPIIDRVASRIVRLAARHVVGAKQREFDAFATSELEWTALRPPIVTDGPARGYRLSERLRPAARVPRADVAAAMVDQLACYPGRARRTAARLTADWRRRRRALGHERSSEGSRSDRWPGLLPAHSQ